MADWGTITANSIAGIALVVSAATAFRQARSERRTEARLSRAQAERVSAWIRGRPALTDGASSQRAVIQIKNLSTQPIRDITTWIYDASNQEPLCYIETASVGPGPNHTAELDASSCVEANRRLSEGNLIAVWTFRDAGGLRWHYGPDGLLTAGDLPPLG